MVDPCARTRRKPLSEAHVWLAASCPPLGGVDAVRAIERKGRARDSGIGLIFDGGLLGRELVDAAGLLPTSRRALSLSLPLKPL